MKETSGMRIEIFNFGSDWIWELRDNQGHPVCKSAPRHGTDYMSKRSCVKSAERFLDTYVDERIRIAIYHKGEFISGQNLDKSSPPASSGLTILE